MKTEIIKIDVNNIENNKIAYAAEIIKKGGLVAFPTETVYGLGANALNPDAVKNIFKAKGRPSDNPLIVHISKIEQLNDLVIEVPSAVQKLISRFWPGPLTIILKRSCAVSDEITAGLDTVAVRMPSHPIALALINMSSCPIAAPSANSSGKPSPTRANHVIEDLKGKIDLIIDGGPTSVGVESTVLDMTSSQPVILRPGGITLEQLNEVLEHVLINVSEENNSSNSKVPRSPGLKYRHYSPKAKIIIVDGEPAKAVEKIKELAEVYEKENVKIGILATEQTKNLYNVPIVISMGDREKADIIASKLFNCFREFDHLGIQLILAESINEKGIGSAVMNRLIKASGHNIIKV